MGDLGIPLDADWLANATSFAATGSKAICVLPQVFLNGNNTPQKTNFTVKPIDQNAWPGWTPASSISACQYEVISGANAIDGVNASGNTVTLPWTNRTCNASVTIAVGASGQCNVDGSYTCLVLFRDQNIGGSWGDTVYNEYNISY